MSIKNKSQLKEYFITGAKPTQDQFSDFIDSSVILTTVTQSYWVSIIGDIPQMRQDYAASSITTDGTFFYAVGVDYNYYTAVVYKIDYKGEVVWKKMMNNNSFGEGIVYKNGHLYVWLSNNDSGESLIFKLKPNGDEIYSIVLGTNTSNIGYIYEFDIDENENIYFIGIQYDNTSNEIFIGKVTGNGILQWCNQYGIHPISGSETDNGMSIKYYNNHIYVTGESDTYDIYTGYNISTLKIDDDGNIVWGRITQVASPHYFNPASITVDSNGNVYTLCTYNFNSGYRFCIIKYDNDGNLIWQHYYSTADSWAVSIDTDDQFLYVLSNTNKYVFSKINLDGSIVYEKQIGNQYDYTWYNRGHRSLIVYEDSILITAYSYIGDWDANAIILKLKKDGSIPDGNYGYYTIETNETNTNLIETGVISANFIGTASDYRAATASGTMSNAYINTNIIEYFYENNNEYVNINSGLNVNESYILPSYSGKPFDYLQYPETGNILNWAGAPSLQKVLDAGNTASNNIEIDNGSVIRVINGSDVSTIYPYQNVIQSISNTNVMYANGIDLQDNANNKNLKIGYFSGINGLTWVNAGVEVKLSAPISDIPLLINLPKNNGTLLAKNSITIFLDTSTYNVTPDDYYIDVDTANPVSHAIILPSVLNFDDGKEYCISDCYGGASASHISIACYGTEKINGLPTYTITNNYGSLTLHSNKSKSKWIITSTH